MEPAKKKTKFVDPQIPPEIKSSQKWLCKDLSEKVLDFLRLRELREIAGTSHAFRRDVSALLRKRVRHVAEHFNIFMGSSLKRVAFLSQYKQKYPMTLYLNCCVYFIVDKNLKRTTVLAYMDNRGSGESALCSVRLPTIRPEHFTKAEQWYEQKQNIITIELLNTILTNAFLKKSTDVYLAYYDPFSFNAITPGAPAEIVSNREVFDEHARFTFTNGGIRRTLKRFSLQPYHHASIKPLKDDDIPADVSDLRNSNASLSTTGFSRSVLRLVRQSDCHIEIESDSHVFTCGGTYKCCFLDPFPLLRWE